MSGDSFEIAAPVDTVNPPENVDKRLAMLQHVYIKKKLRNVEGKNILQVGAFLRPDMGPARENEILLEEEPLVFFRDGEYDIDDGEFPIETSLSNLSAEAKVIYDTLYCSPELVNVVDVDEARWLTNRFRAILSDHSKPQYPMVVVEAVYKHGSCIDHSCLNANAKGEMRLRPSQTPPNNSSHPSIPHLEIVATRDIYPDEEILIHYDYEQFHDSSCGKRTKPSETVHSELYHSRGLLCGSDCILRISPSGNLHQPSLSVVPTTPNPRRKILTPSSPTAAFRKRIEKKPQT